MTAQDLTGARGRARSRAAAADAGFSMIELVIAIVIMSMVMALVTAGLLHLVSRQRLTLRLQEAQSQVGRVFQRLDGELQYASDVAIQALPGVTSAYPAQLYLITADVDRCFALDLMEITAVD